MKTKLTRIGDDVLLVLDPPLLDELGLGDSSEVEVSMNAGALVVTPVRNAAHQDKLRKIIDEMDEQYAGVFKRLAE